MKISENDQLYCLKQQYEKDIRKIKQSIDQYKLQLSLLESEKVKCIEEI